MPFPATSRSGCPRSALVTVCARGRLRGLAARRRSGRWSTCATGGARRARPTSLGAALLSRRPGRDHPGLRHGRPRGAGVLAGRRLVPRPVAAVAAVLFGAAQPALERAAGPARRASRSGRPGAPCWSASSSARPDRGAGGHPDLRADHASPTARRSRRRWCWSGSWSRCPVGALAGGVLIRRLPAGVVAAVGMVLAAVGFGLMAGWGFESLDAPDRPPRSWRSTGLGFGLALAPVNAALLASTDDAVARRHQRAARGRPDGRHAGRHLGPDHDRAAALLRGVQVGASLEAAPSDQASSRAPQDRGVAAYTRL